MSWYKPQGRPRVFCLAVVQDTHISSSSTWVGHGEGAFVPGRPAAGDCAPVELAAEALKKGVGVLVSKDGGLFVARHLDLVGRWAVVGDAVGALYCAWNAAWIGALWRTGAGYGHGAIGERVDVRTVGSRLMLR